jgi:hypothetical protein
LDPLADGIFYIYEVRNPLAIAFLADEYRVVSLSDSLKAVLANQEHPWSQGIVYLETKPESAISQDGDSQGANIADLKSSAEIVRETLNSIDVNVSTPAKKYLVLSYLYRPNWKAYLGSEELQIYRAYGGFMAVEVPPGNSTIRFKYTPIDVYLGLLLTACAFALPVVGYIVQRINKRHEVDR